MGLEATAAICVPDLNEPSFIPDIFATEVASITEIAGNYRVTFAVARAQIGMAPAERLVVCHLILPRCVVEGLGLVQAAALHLMPHVGVG